MLGDDQRDTPFCEANTAIFAAADKRRSPRSEETQA